MSSSIYLAKDEHGWKLMEREYNAQGLPAEYRRICRVTVQQAREAHWRPLPLVPGGRSDG